MRFLSADTIYPIHTAPLQNSVVVTKDDGTLLDIISNTDIDALKIQHYKGSFCPGFVNAHCHLELSFMKGKIQTQTGLHHFIKEVEALKKPSDEEVEQALVQADQEMHANGIVAVGDISNTHHSFYCKAKSKIHYYTFIEVYAFDENRAEAAMEKGLRLQQEWQQQSNNPCSIVPHAPYSASTKLLSLLAEQAQKNKTVLSIHNQETADENVFFLEKKGSILERLKSFHIPTETWQAPGKTSLQATLPYLPKKNKVQLVHNTYTSEEDIQFAKKNHPHLFWCLCPKANLYIENSLPPIPLLTKYNSTITLGTDSYASNNTLSIFEEIKSIKKHFPAISTQEVLTWATLNGAKMLGIDSVFGSLEKGKKPGINVIDEAFEKITPILNYC
ncbi:MAG: amidohydrolase family protein [Bacteroidetes bacterium]|nr:amidohydrolase family protein [Bacteroidota bacterium]